MENAPRTGGALEENLVLSLGGENQTVPEREPNKQEDCSCYRWVDDGDDLVLYEWPQAAGMD